MADDNATTCYTRWEGDLIRYESGDYPCTTGPGHHHCCGIGDSCHGANFCYITRDIGHAVTGFYLGGCTDASWSSPACPQNCLMEYATTDVVYNASTGLWACCWGREELDCDYLSDLTFPAPPPEEVLLSQPSALSSSLTPASSTLPSSCSSASVSTPTSFQQGGTPQPSLSGDTAVQGGRPQPSPSGNTAQTSSDSSSIPVSTFVPANVVPVVALVAAIALDVWLWRRKNRKTGQSEKPNEHGAPYHAPKAQLPGDQGRVELGTPSRVELNAPLRPKELHGGLPSRPNELRGVPVSELPTGR